jgi:hypothetical protein
MKSSRSQNNSQSKQGQTHKPKPEIRDDLNSNKERKSDKASQSTDRGKKK